MCLPSAGVVVGYSVLVGIASRLVVGWLLRHIAVGFRSMVTSSTMGDVDAGDVINKGDVDAGDATLKFADIFYLKRTGA